MGTICGSELKINLKNTVAGNPLLTINSINWTLFPRQNTDVINTSIRRELFKSCLKKYTYQLNSLYFKKNNINILYLLQILLHIDTKMKISFTDKILESDHQVFIVSNKASKN